MGRLLLLLMGSCISSLDAGFALGSIDAVVLCPSVCVTEMENIVTHFHLLSITLKGIISRIVRWGTPNLITDSTWHPHTSSSSV